MRLLVLLMFVLTPGTGLACERTLRLCQKQVTELIAYRTQAIQYAFGELPALPPKIDVKFVSQDDPDYQRFGGRLAYQRAQQRLIVPRRYAALRIPNPLRWAGNYWPFYQGELYLKEYPLIGAIDNALWTAYMEEAAQRGGVAWPHEGCSAVDVASRLPCEMLLEGVAEVLTMPRPPLFNENRLDRIWPDDFASFQRRVTRSQTEYRDVQRYGGILLVRPLVGEFGVPRALAYIARTPFRVESNSLRIAALNYQRRARETLSSDADTGPVASSDSIERAAAMP